MGVSAVCLQVFRSGNVLLCVCVRAHTCTVTDGTTYGPNVTCSFCSASIFSILSCFQADRSKDDGNKLCHGTHERHR